MVKPSEANRRRAKRLLGNYINAAGIKVDFEPTPPGLETAVEEHLQIGGHDQVEMEYCHLCRQAEVVLGSRWCQDRNNDQQKKCQLLALHECYHTDGEIKWPAHKLLGEVDPATYVPLIKPTVHFPDIVISEEEIEQDEAKKEHLEYGQHQDEGHPQGSNYMELCPICKKYGVDRGCRVPDCALLREHKYDCVDEDGIVVGHAGQAVIPQPEPVEVVYIFVAEMIPGDEQTSEAFYSLKAAIAACEAVFREANDDEDGTLEFPKFEREGSLWENAFEQRIIRTRLR